MSTKYPRYAMLLCLPFIIGTPAQASNSESEIVVIEQQAPVEDLNIDDNDAFTDIFDGEEITDIQACSQSQPTVQEQIQIVTGILKSPDLTWLEKWKLLYVFAKAASIEKKNSVVAHLSKHKKAYIITLAGIGCAVAVVVIVKQCKEKPEAHESHN